MVRAPCSHRRGGHRFEPCAAQSRYDGFAAPLLCGAFLLRQRFFGRFLQQPRALTARTSRREQNRAQLLLAFNIPYVQGHSSLCSIHFAGNCAFEAADLRVKSIAERLDGSTRDDLVDEDVAALRRSLGVKVHDNVLQSAEGG